MPRKPRYTKEDITQVAFELVKQHGYQQLDAREVAKILGTSTSPIYTCFASMDELQDAVYMKAKQHFVAYMQGINDMTPAFKEFGLRTIRYGMEEPNLYEVIFHTHIDEFVWNQPEFEDIFKFLLEEISSTMHISLKAAESILRQMIVYANGIICFDMNSKNTLDWQQINQWISEVYLGMVLLHQIKEDSFSMEMAHSIAKCSENANAPVEKKK